MRLLLGLGRPFKVPRWALSNTHKCTIGADTVETKQKALLKRGAWAESSSAWEGGRLLHPRLAAQAFPGSASFLGCLCPWSYARAHLVLLGPFRVARLSFRHVACSIRVSGSSAESLTHWLLLPPSVHANSPQLCLALCSPMDRSLPGSSVHGHEYGHGLPCPPPGGLSDPGIEPVSLTSPALAGGFFTTIATWESLLSAPPKFFLFVLAAGRSLCSLLRTDLTGLHARTGSFRQWVPNRVR